MTEVLKVVNIKCGGCEKSIKMALEAEGIKNVEVSHENQTVSFDGDRELASKILEHLGYPEAEGRKAKSLLKNARSYTTCAVGSILEGLEDKRKRGKKFWLLLALPVLFLLLVIYVLIKLT